MSKQDLLSQYTTIQWIAAVVVALLSFPIGLVVPIYFYIKASNGDGTKQGAWEAWAVILTSIIGILAVELGGETGAKIAIGVFFLLPVLLAVLAVIGSFVLGFGGVASAPALGVVAVGV